MRAANEDHGRQPALEHVERAVGTFRMLSDVTRVQMLWALMDDELSVNELATVVGKPAASMSQHLAKMRLARLVSCRRDGARVYYRLDSSHVRQLVRDAVVHAERTATAPPAHDRAGTPAAAAR